MRKTRPPSISGTIPTRASMSSPCSLFVISKDPALFSGPCPVVLRVHAPIAAAADDEVVPREPRLVGSLLLFSPPPPRTRIPFFSSPSGTGTPLPPTGFGSIAGVASITLSDEGAPSPTTTSVRRDSRRTTSTSEGHRFEGCHWFESGGKRRDDLAGRAPLGLLRGSSADLVDHCGPAGLLTKGPLRPPCERQTCRCCYAR